MPLSQQQIDQLNIAAARIKAGSGSATDRTNLDYAIKKYGFAPTDTTAQAQAQPSLAADKVQASSTDITGTLPPEEPANPLGNLRIALKQALNEASQTRLQNQFTQIAPEAQGLPPGSLGSVLSVLKSGIAPQASGLFNDVIAERTRQDELAQKQREFGLNTFKALTDGDYPAILGMNDAAIRALEKSANLPEGAGLAAKSKLQELSDNKKNLTAQQIQNEKAGIIEKLAQANKANAEAGQIGMPSADKRLEAAQKLVESGAASDLQDAMDQISQILPSARVGVAEGNNNPGNLRFANQPGATQSGNGFAKFATPADGLKATINDIEMKIKGVSATGLTQENTLQDLINKYAPATDGNDPVSYAQNVANKIGVKPTAKLSELQNHIPELSEAMISVEDPKFYKKLVTQGLLPGNYLPNKKASLTDIDNIRTAMRGIGTLLPSDNARGSFYGEINRRLGAGNIDGAKELLVSNALSTLPAQEKQYAVGRAVAVKDLTALQNLLHDYVAKGGNTNIFTGSEEAVLNKVGKTTNPSLANIANQIAGMIIDYRHAVSGAAFSTTESAQYEKLFPSIGNIPELNDAKIKSLTSLFGRNQRTILETVIGPQTYATVFGNDAESPVVGASDAARNIRDKYKAGKMPGK